MNVLALMTFGILSANGIATEVATNVADFPAPLVRVCFFLRALFFMLTLLRSSQT